MTHTYTAKAKQNLGRKSWLIEFRHPLRNDSSNKPGKKIRKGLGTEDKIEALRLEDQLNQLLADQSLWSVASEAVAKNKFDSKVVEIFYSEISPTLTKVSDLRNKLLPLPQHEEGYARVALLGVPGAGKTTLLRQLIGTNPKTERFPSTSVNRTTTFPTEVVMREGDAYEAVVTFMSEHEARFEIEESLSSAILEAVDGDIQKVASSLLEKSDMRFRLKYLLGDFVSEASKEFDPYDDDPVVEDLPFDSNNDPNSVLSAAEKAHMQNTLFGYVQRTMSLAQNLKLELEKAQGPISNMESDDKSAALDLIEEQAVASDEFLELVSDILDELRTKFTNISSGRYEKSTTGWPFAWYIKLNATERETFLKDLRFFSGIAYQSWGKLLTPLVNGLRVVGPFKPVWANKSSRLILVDTEGLGHKANATADLPEQALSLFHEADVILLVDSAKSGMVNFAAGKALEGVINTGNTKKLAVVFTHMDTVKGDNLRGQAKLEHVFGGLRNVVENQLAKSVPVEASRYMLDHLRSSTFYVGRMDEYEPKPAIPELVKLLEYLGAAQKPIFEPVAFPEYSNDHLVLAIQEAARDFRQQWQGRLGLFNHSDLKPVAWQSIKALSRRYAEGWDDGYILQPTSNLVAALSAAISRYLDSPIQWQGNPTNEQKRETIDQIKSIVSVKLPVLSRQRLRTAPQPKWLEAHSLRGKNSTFDRKNRIEAIYEFSVPVPDSRGDVIAYEFLEEVKEIVMTSIRQVEDEVKKLDEQLLG